jgi:hypothetical protein
MAQKKRTSTTKKKPKVKSMYPVVRRWELGGLAEASIVRVLDTMRNLSVINRRLYRFGRMPQVKIDMDAGAGQSVQVYALRNDWAVLQAFREGYKTYMEVTKEERKALGKNQIARWEDFRVSPGVTGDAMYPVLHTPLLADAVLSQGSFPLSTITLTDQSLKTFTWGLPGASEFGLLQEYDLKGNAQTSPDSDTNDVPYANTTNLMDESQAQNLQEDGANPPYTPTGVNAASPWVRVNTLGETVGGSQRLSTGFFDAPCGLVVLVGNGPNWNSNAMLCEVKAGDYKGVHAPSMLE